MTRHESTFGELWEPRNILEGEPKFCTLCSHSLDSYRCVTGNQSFDCPKCGWYMVQIRPKNPEVHSRKNELTSW